MTFAAHQEKRGNNIYGKTITPGSITICDPARMHEVPVTAPHNRVSGNVTCGMKPGPVPYMNAEGSWNIFKGVCYSRLWEDKEAYINDC